MDNITSASMFLVRMVFDLYILILLLRLILQMVGASFYNPLCQFIVKITNPLVLPLRRVLPRLQAFDLTIVILLVLMDLIKFALLIMLADAGLPDVFSLVYYVIVDLLKQTINLYFYGILIVVILSWFGPGQANPVLDVLYQVTEPVLRPVRRYIPPVSGFDLSPLVVLISLQLLLILLA